MLVGEMALEICLLAKRGKGLRAIAREFGVSRNTVRRYPRDDNAELYRPRPRHSGKLAAFDDYIAKQLTEAAPDRLAGTVTTARASGTRLHRRLHHSQGPSDAAAPAGGCGA
jgi:transposase